MPERAPVPKQEFEFEALLREALSLADRYEADEAIWQALTNMNIQKFPERVRLFKLIKAEMRKRTHREDRQRKEEETPIEEARREQMMRNARAHELRQPRDAWDNAYNPDDKS